MMNLLSVLQMDWFAPRFCIAAATDNMNLQKALVFEDSLNGVKGPSAQFMPIYRSREVGQSYITPVWTTEGPPGCLHFVKSLTFQGLLIDLEAHTSLPALFNLPTSKHRSLPEFSYLQSKMAGAFVQILLEHLNSLTRKEVGLLCGVEKEMNKLSNLFSTIQAMLEDAEEKQVKDNAIKNWLRKLKQAAYMVDDILDDCTTEAS